MKLKVVLNEAEEIDLSRIDGLSSLSQSTSDNSEPQYGIIPNTGSIDLVDIDRKIQNMINSGELPASSASADIYIDDKLVQKHITTDSTYDKNGNELSISLSNEVDTLNNTVFGGINYEGKPMSAYDVLFRVFSEYYGESFTEEKFKELMSEKIVYGLKDELYGPIYSYLQKIIIEIPYVESSKTFKEIIDDFCAMAQLQMYVDTDGYIKATSARPIVGDWDFIILNQNNQMSEIKEDLFIKNKYNGIEIPENKYSLVKEFDTIVGTVEQKISDADISWQGQTTKTKAGIKWLSTDYYVTYIHSFCKYGLYTGSARFEKKKNNNLEEITNIYNNFEKGENLSYTLTYKKGESAASGTVKVRTVLEGSNTVIYTDNAVYNQSIGDVVFSEIPNSGKISSSEFEYTLTAPNSNWELVTTNPNTFPYDIEDISIIDEGETFVVNYSIVCSKIQTNFWGFSDSASILDKENNGILTDKPVNGKHTEEVAYELEININGDRYVISFNEEIIKNTPSSGVINSFTYPNSSFITDKTRYETVKVSSLITNKLLKDYSDGVRTATLTTNIKKFSSLHGYNHKITDNYLIEIGDIVYPKRDGDGPLYLYGESVGMYDNLELDIYKTTGFNLVYDGEPLNKLELVNVKLSPPLLNFEYDQETDGYIVRSNLKYGTLNSKYLESKEVEIPETYDDGIHGTKKVSIVGVEAFNHFTKLERIILPSGIKAIYPFAFGGCTSLKSIVLPTGLDEITGDAFNGCSSLEVIDIPNTVTKIGSYAFVGVSPSMVINCNVTQKPDGFENYWNVYNYAGNTLQTNFIPSLIFTEYEHNGRTYWQVAGLLDETITHLTIPEKYNGVYVVAIADNAFKDNNTIRTVETGNMLAYIGKNAFWHCRSLYKVTLGYGIESIGDLAFDGCEKLISVDNRSALNLTTGSTSNGYIKYYADDKVSLRFIEDFVFTQQNSYPYNMTLISYDGKERNIVLPTKGTYEGENIAYDIYRYAFNNCDIETVSAGENVINIEDYAFNNCANLTSFAFTERGTTLNAAIFSGCSSLSKVYIPSTVTTIPATMFYLSPFNGCPSTTKIYCGAKSKPSGWGTYWNYYNVSNQLAVTYNTTREQYETK